MHSIVNSLEELTATQIKFVGTMSSSVFVGNEGNFFMLAAQRQSSSLAFIESTELCLSTTTIANETRNSWLSVSSYSASDWISIEHSLVGSAKIKYFGSMTGPSISDEAAVNGLNLGIEPQLLSPAIVMEQVDVALTPSVSISFTTRGSRMRTATTRWCR